MRLSWQLKYRQIDQKKIANIERQRKSKPQKSIQDIKRTKESKQLEELYSRKNSKQTIKVEKSISRDKTKSKEVCAKIANQAERATNLNIELSIKSATIELII